VSIDADHSSNLELRLDLVASYPTATYTPCLVRDTPVCDRDVSGLSCHAIAVIARRRSDGCGASGAIELKSGPTVAHQPREPRDRLKLAQPRAAKVGCIAADKSPRSCYKYVHCASDCEVIG